MIFRILLLLLLPFNSFAISIKDYSPFKYEVLFTNPICKKYFYEAPILNLLGEEVLNKKENAYCTPTDARRVNKQQGTPHEKILKWIKDPETKEIFMAYLSFSKSSVIRSLCSAIKKRNVKLTLIVDKNNDEHRMRRILSLKECAKSNNSSVPVILTGGHKGEGFNKTGFAHNKLVIINPNSKDKVRLIFSSGNMSSGTTTHHENWHFVTTNINSYFAQSHICLRDGLLNYEDSKSTFAHFIKSCRKKIKSPEEDDIKVFFIPGEGRKATKFLHSEFDNSINVKMAAHRFSNTSIIKMIDRNLKRPDFKVSIIVDDDLHWAGIYNQDFGRNTLYEYKKLMKLKEMGLEIKFIETFMDNIEQPKSLQLQHNKFMIFTKPNANGTIFTGAGNLTNAAFYKNFENFYLISIPEIHKAFIEQYDYLISIALSKNEMPIKLEIPKK